MTAGHEMLAKSKNRQQGEQGGGFERKWLVYDDWHKSILSRSSEMNEGPCLVFDGASKKCHLTLLRAGCPVICFSSCTQFSKPRSNSEWDVSGMMIIVIMEIVIVWNISNNHVTKMTKWGKTTEQLKSIKLNKHD